MENVRDRGEALKDSYECSGEVHTRDWTRLTFPSIDSGEANMLFFETPFKLFPDLLEPPPYNRDTNMHAPI